MNMITDNLISNVMANSKQPIPEVGMGATILMYTDRRPATIIRVGKDAKWVDVQEDKAIRTDKNGMSDAQTYRYEADPEGTIIRYSLRENGRYVRRGDSMKGQSIAIGHRSKYHDFSF